MHVIIIWSFFQAVIFHMHCTITMGQNGQSLPTVGQYIAVCSASALRKRLRIRSVIFVNYHYITDLCPFNLLIGFKCYNTV